MSASFAVVLYRPAEVSDRALSLGFAVALGGWDVPAPSLLVADVPGVPGYCAAFYRSGLRGLHADYEERDHAIELFEDELPPGLSVRDAAAELGAPEATVYAALVDEDALVDDAWRFGAQGYLRRFVREGDAGPEAGWETLEDEEVEPIDEAAIPARRGSAFLSSELGVPALPALMGALFAASRRVEIRFVEPTPEAIEEEVAGLHRVLGRTKGRGAFAPPDTIGGAEAPALYRAFARTYDFADPTDPEDLYRELSIGAIVGTLRFLRAPELVALAADPTWAASGGRGLYPVATLRRSALGASGAGAAVLALVKGSDELVLVAPGGVEKPAGPRFGELLRYLTLGWKRRSEVEDDTIDALMLRAKLRVR